MAQTTIPTDVLVLGNLAATTMTVPLGAVSDGQVVGSAGVQATKLQQQRAVVHADTFATTTAALRKAIAVVNGAVGALVSFGAGATTEALGNSTVTVKLYKNGSDILSADITLDDTLTALAVRLAAGFSSTALAAGDVLEIVLTVSAGSGTLPAGFFARLVFTESPA